jgi:hypothetical protein
LLAAAYGNGLFVAVGRQGGVVTSPDGITWTSRDAGRTDNDLTAVAFGNQMFLAVGQNGRLFTSANGIAWSNIYQGTAGRSVAGMSNAFVLVGASGSILATTDGQVLQTVPSGITNDLNSVTYANGLFGAAAKQGRIILSSNIVNWVGSTVNTNADWADFSFGDGGSYVAVAETGALALSGVIPPDVGGKVQTIGATQFLTLSYSRLKSATNLSYVTAASSNLTTWASGVLYTLPVETNDYGPTLRIGVRDSAPVTSAPKRFLKLTITPF